MGSLAPFWHHLERQPHASETRSEWQRTLGDAFPTILHHLTSTGRFASFVASPRLNAPDMRVVQYPDGTLAAVCDTGDTPNVPLTADDLGLMTVSTRSLRTAISAALGLRTSTVAAVPFPGSLRIGTWEPQPETAFPVIMVTHADDREVALSLRESVLAAGKPVLVLTPTDLSWTDDLLDWCEARRAMLGSLTAMIETVEDHAWKATDAWDKLLDGFARRAGFIGLNWRVPMVTGKRAVRHVVFDTNFWKSFVHARLAVPMGDPGSLALFGHKPEMHRLLAEHLTSEFRVKTEGRGRTVDEWKLRVSGLDNHWLDCLVGSAVSIEHEPVVAAEHLDERSTLTTVLSVTYRVRR